jgi:hypothetical protein
MQDVTQTDLTPPLPSEAREESPCEAEDRRHADSTTVDVSPEKPRSDSRRRPTIGLANHNTPADTEMTTPTDELATVSNDETFPIPRNDVGPRDDAGILRWTPPEETTPAGNEETVAVEASNNSELPSVAEDLLHDADEEWEDNYDQSDEPEPSPPRQEFRPEVIKDDDAVSLGPDEDDVTTNPWV